MKNSKLLKLILAALLIAMSIVLRIALAPVQVLGQSISPLHIPALIAGLTLGCGWGALVGLLIPPVNSLLSGMPPFPNVALPMAFELAAYAALCGLLYPLFIRALKRRSSLPAMVCTIVPAMIGGRIAGGIVKALLLTAGVIGSSSPFTFAAFFASYFTGTAAGMLVHMIAVPAVVIALEKAHLSPLGRRLSA